MEGGKTMGKTLKRNSSLQNNFRDVKVLLKDK